MTQNDVKLPEAPVVEPITPTPVLPEPPAEPKPGEKTDSALLLKSLQDEREKRRILEDEKVKLEQDLQELRSAAGNTGEQLSEEGTLLKKQIDDLSGRLALTENTKRLEALHAAYPALKDKSTEFDNYRNDPNNKGMSVETAAKAFLAESGLLAAPPPRRKGLEDGTGGAHAPPKQGMSPAEIDELRVNNYREYSRRVRSGELSL